MYTASSSLKFASAKSSRGSLRAVRAKPVARSITAHWRSPTNPHSSTETDGKDSPCIDFTGYLHNCSIRIPTTLTLRRPFSTTAPMKADSQVRATTYSKYSTCMRMIVRMNLDRPFRVITPTVDGDVLSVLAGADASFTPPQVRDLIGDHSIEGVRRSLNRLVREGVVTSSRVGQAFAYRLNRGHLAAPAVVAMAGLRVEFLSRVSSLVGSWRVGCEFAALFGSAATKRMTAESDIDLFVVRPNATDTENDRWRDQLDTLVTEIAAWTGNDARVLEMNASETQRGLRSSDRVLLDIRRHGIRLHGDVGYLQTGKRTAK